jgi:hypothetical protein
MYSVHLGTLPSPSSRRQHAFDPAVHRTADDEELAIVRCASEGQKATSGTSGWVASATFARSISNATAYLAESR